MVNHTLMLPLLATNWVLLNLVQGAYLDVNLSTDHICQFNHVVAKYQVQSCDRFHCRIL